MINEPQKSQGAGRRYKQETTLRIFLGVLLVGFLLSVSCTYSGAPTPTPTRGTTSEQIVNFARSVLALEEERDGVVADFQYLSMNMIDMSTAEVFRRADVLAAQQADLNSRLLKIETPDHEIAAVHSTFAIAYRTELEAYKLFASSLRAGLTGMQAYVSGLLKADEFYRQAHDELDKLLAGAGVAVGEPRKQPPIATPITTQRHVVAPTVEAALEALFWAAAAIAGVEAETPFEEARTLLGFALFQSLYGKLGELEKYGVDYKVDLPYCLNATYAAAAILAIEKSDSPVDAAPHANRAIEAITAMDSDIRLARDPGRPTLPTEDPMQLCARAVEEVTQTPR